MLKPKFLIFFSLLTFFIGLQTHAQVFYGGLQLGINGSQIWGDEMKGFNKGGVLAGVFIDFPVSKRSFFSMEMNYTQKGSRRMMDEFNQNPGFICDFPSHQNIVRNPMHFLNQWKFSFNFFNSINLFNMFGA